MSQPNTLAPLGTYGCQSTLAAQAAMFAARLPTIRLSRNMQLLCLMAVVALVCCLITPDAMAASTGASMPWESPLKKLQTSITGPVAFFASIVGLAVSLMGLIWGGDLSGVMKTMMVMVLIISVLIALTNFLSVMFGVGAEIAAILPVLPVGIV